MSEVNVVYQMYNTLSKQDKMRFMQMLGMPTKMTEIIDSTTMEEFLDKYRFHDGVFCPHCGLVDCKKNGNTKEVYATAAEALMKSEVANLVANWDLYRKNAGLN